MYAIYFVSLVETLVLGYIIQTFWRLDLFDKRVDTDDDVDVDDNNDEEFEMKQEEDSCPSVQWGAWSPCTRSCGGGLRVRHRTIVLSRNCTDGDAVQVHACSVKPCLLNREYVSQEKINDDEDSSNYHEATDDVNNEGDNTADSHRDSGRHDADDDSAFKPHSHSWRTDDGKHGDKYDSDGRGDGGTKEREFERHASFDSYSNAEDSFSDGMRGSDHDEHRQRMRYKIPRRTGSQKHSDRFQRNRERRYGEDDHSDGGHVSDDNEEGHTRRYTDKHSDPKVTKTGTDEARKDKGCDNDDRRNDNVENSRENDNKKEREYKEGKEDEEDSRGGRRRTAENEEEQRRDRDHDDDNDDGNNDDDGDYDEDEDAKQEEEQDQDDLDEQEEDDDEKKKRKRRRRRRKKQSKDKSDKKEGKEEDAKGEPPMSVDSVPCSDVTDRSPDDPSASVKNLFV